MVGGDCTVGNDRNCLPCSMVVAVVGIAALDPPYADHPGILTPPSSDLRPSPLLRQRRTFGLEGRGVTGYPPARV